MIVIVIITIITMTVVCYCCILLLSLCVYIYIYVLSMILSVLSSLLSLYIYIYISHPYIISSADKTSMQSPLDLRHPACQRTLRSVKTHGGSLRFRTSHDWRIISHVRLDHDHYDHVVWSTVFEWKSNDACIGYLQMGWLLSK